MWYTMHVAAAVAIVSSSCRNPQTPVRVALYVLSCSMSQGKYCRGGDQLARLLHRGSEGFMGDGATRARGS